jgi:hypothetical protein
MPCAREAAQNDSQNKPDASGLHCPEKAFSNASPPFFFLLP